MILSESELDQLHSKYPYPRFSKAEYKRRYENVRNLLKQKNLDCLLVIGGSAAYGRLWFNVRYLTNMMGKAEMCYYCLFPREGDPCLIVRPGHALSEGMLARTAVRELVVGGADIVSGVVTKINELRCGDGRIGIVEYDPVTSIPKNHWDYLTTHLPKAEFIFVTREFLALRHIKSEEEIQFLERSAEIGDRGIMALSERVRPGMTESQLFAIVYEAVLNHGGEMGMVQIGSAPLAKPGINDQRPRPVERVISAEELINNELGVFYNGYEAQTGKPIVIGQPTDVIRKMGALATEGYKRMAETLYPGKSSRDSMRVEKWIQESDFELYGSYLQGMGGTQPRHEPLVRPDGVNSPFSTGDLVYQAGMVFALQMHIVTKDRSAGIFLADTFAVTSSGPRCLNKVPPQLIQV